MPSRHFEDPRTPIDHAKILELEQLARRLEPGEAERAEMANRVFGFADNFVKNISEAPAYVHTEEDGIGLYESPISEDAIDIDSALDLIHKHVHRPALNPASGGHLGYIPGGGIYPSALADFLAAVGNRFAGLYYASSGAVRMENLLVRWLTGLVNFPPTSAGDLTSGGSVANLIGIVTARDAHQLKAHDYARSVVYLTQQTHHSIDKALRIAGLRECIKRSIDTDGRHRMRADVLEAAIARDENSGLKPWLIIASAGTTDTGAIDPLGDIADIAGRHGLWLHVDAAYGGFFILCREGATLLHGISEADSIVMDPHKGLFLPYGSGAVLVKDRQKLYDAHYYKASYLQDAVEPKDVFSPSDHSPELTKHFRGLRLWLPLKLFGLAPFRACLEEKLLLARYFYHRIKETDGFEVGDYPDLSVVTYRYKPERGDANSFNKRLLKEVQRDGRVFISSTMLDDRFTLRLAVLSFRTHLHTIDTAIEILEQKAKELVAGG
jgi:glutamate/tyrosine decarboxylase-like PLP-dependent enzyme